MIQTIKGANVTFLGVLNPALEGKQIFNANITFSLQSGMLNIESLGGSTILTSISDVFIESKNQVSSV